MTATLIGAAAIVLFVSAGTLSYWPAWVYLGLQLVSVSATNLYLARRDPMLLERRLTSEHEGEADPLQRRIMRLMRVQTLGVLCAAGLEHRFGLARPSALVVFLGAFVFAIGAWIVFSVFRANSYTSSIIEVAPDQPVVRDGPYRYVRHPMYTGVLVMGIATAMVLGSYAAAVMLLPMTALLLIRIRAEERFLSEHLAGYADYVQATRARLVPGVF